MDSDDPVAQLLAEIARRFLSIETLECRSRDALDFHTLHVLNIAYALEAAYKAGQEAAKAKSGGAA